MDNFDDDHDVKLIVQELEMLRNEEKEINKWTNTLQEILADLAKDETNNEFSYVNFDDIKAVNSTGKEDDQPFLVIRAPKGTLLEVPNTEPNVNDEYPHKIKLTSQNEEIFVYVVTNDAGNNENQETSQQPVAKPAF